MARESLYGLLLYGDELYSKSEHDVWLAYTDSLAVANVVVEASGVLITGQFALASLTVEAFGTLGRIMDFDGRVNITIGEIVNPYLGEFWNPIEIPYFRWDVKKPHTGQIAWGKSKVKGTEWRPVDPNARYPYP